MAALSHRRVEKAVLAAAMLDSRLAERTCQELHEVDFCISEHVEIWRAMARCRALGRPVDFLTLQSDLETHGALERAGGLANLATLEVDLPDTSGFDTYLGLLRNATARRQFVEVCSAAVRTTKAEKGEGMPPIAALVDSLKQIEDRHTPKGLALASSRFSAVRERVANPAPRGVVGVPTGLPALDKLLLGWCPGLYVLGGRPGTGKTAFAMVAAKAAADLGMPVAFFSLEMGAEELAVRMTSMDTGVEFWRIRSGYLSASERSMVNRSLAEMEDLPVLIDDSAHMTVAKIAAALRRSVREQGTRLCIVDYLGLVARDPSVRHENRNLEIGEYTRAFKLLSKELRIPVLLLHQLSRASEHRTDGRPRLSDLRDSGNIEQDADVVIFTWLTGSAGATLIIAKHRNGPLADVLVKNRLDICRFDPA